MTNAISQDQIDAAKAYEALCVPALFGQWATKVADTAQLQSGQRVLAPGGHMVIEAELSG